VDRTAANAAQGYSYDLSDEEAQELGRRSIIAAGHRDAYSGNTCNLFHVRENGWEFIGESESLPLGRRTKMAGRRVKRWCRCRCLLSRQLRRQRAVVRVRGEEEGGEGRGYGCGTVVHLKVVSGRAACMHTMINSQTPLLSLAISRLPRFTGEGMSRHYHYHHPSSGMKVEHLFTTQTSTIQ
jgi:hypothetical protein